MRQPPPQPRPPFTEGLDYYLEAGRVVFTAAFLLKRGHCCHSGCRHCPYGFRKNNVPPDQSSNPSRSNP